VGIGVPDEWPVRLGNHRDRSAVLRLLASRVRLGRTDRAGWGPTLPPGRAGWGPSPPSGPPGPATRASPRSSPSGLLRPIPELTLQRPVRADTGDVEHLGDDHPPLALPESQRRDTRVAPE